MNPIDCSISEVKLTYRPKVRVSDRPNINSSKDAFELFYSSWDQGGAEDARLDFGI